MGREGDTGSGGKGTPGGQGLLGEEDPGERRILEDSGDLWEWETPREGVRPGEWRLLGESGTPFGGNWGLRGSRDSWGKWGAPGGGGVVTPEGESGILGWSGDLREEGDSRRGGVETPGCGVGTPDPNSKIQLPERPLLLPT